MSDGKKKKEWSQLWLNYTKKIGSDNAKYFQKISISGFGREKSIINNCFNELERAASEIFDIIPEFVYAEKNDECAKTLDSDYGMQLLRVDTSKVAVQGYSICEMNDTLTIEASDEQGLLYGVFEVIRKVSMEKPLQNLKLSAKPDNKLRMLNHWDNIDGSIERGYSGRSFFFADDEVLVNERTIDYARFAASIGINASVINNVNVRGAANEFITDRYYTKLREMGEIFAGYGIKLFLSVNYAAPIKIGGMDSADPLNEDVRNWWKNKAKEAFREIPNLGGFLVKADSEGNLGPFAYGRTHADGANMMAEAVEPYGGVIVWRCFVYNCQQDWRDRKTDRARAAYDNFIRIDGDFKDNVVLQIKNGPMDFQIREPISPMFGGMKKTNPMLEVQAAQEYTGQQIDLCYLIPLYREVLEFKTYCAPKNDTVKDIISGKCFESPLSGMAAVINTGNDANWTGNDLAAANFYGFGRLAYNMDLTSEEIAEEWVRMTISNDREVIEKVTDMLMNSRRIYEEYTCPLGIGWMVTPATHYGPSVDGYEYSRWGTYHRADHLGVGIDRSTEGTGYAMQYFEPNASMYNKKETCPEELLLFFHRVLYTDKLKNGKTLIQHIYDTHFEGYDEAVQMAETWKGLKDKVDSTVYETVCNRFERQLNNAREWRDQVNAYFYRQSGIEDEKGRPLY